MISIIGTKFLTAGLEEIRILLRDRTEKNVIVKPKCNENWKAFSVLGGVASLSYVKFNCPSPPPWAASGGQLVSSMNNSRAVRARPVGEGSRDRGANDLALTLRRRAARGRIDWAAAARRRRLWPLQISVVGAIQRITGILRCWCSAIAALGAL
ncbi:hypothetical protein EVAR_2709_1 [Eumeta japonica]|uniref:Uncharacterized protein n=1 Tax=Eumeta variegata TaxID=151549 RepID=A0A4C1SME5_EUMVA|nr:hypothetical protein EVAR_2709_1 [Eumeta japonica]